MIEVLIVDDQITVQEILSSYIEEEPSLECVGCVNNGQEAIDFIETHRPHIVLMDIEMPVLDGLTATKIISEQFIDTSIIVISIHKEDSYINTALQIGAKGYLLKNTPAKEMINAIHSAYKGYFQLGPGLLEKYLHNVNESQVNTHDLEQLKSLMLKEFKNLNNNADGQPNTNNSRRQKTKGRGHTDRYASLEKQVYFLSNRIDKLNKKIAFLQQAGILFLLSCAVLGVLILLFIL